MSRGRSKKKKPTARELEELDVFAGLRELLEGQGWTVTVARSLDSRGGHCVVRGQRRAILSGRLAVSDRIEVLAEALRYEDLEDVFVRPDLRQLIEGREAVEAGASVSGGPPADSD